MKIGDRFKIPEGFCDHTGWIVWMSEDGKRIGVKCNQPHYEDAFTKEPYGKKPGIGGRDEVPTKKNTVYIIDVSDVV